MAACAKPPMRWREGCKDCEWQKNRKSVADNTMNDTCSNLCPAPDTRHPRPYVPPSAVQSVFRRPLAIVMGLLRNRMLWVGVIGLLLSGWLTGLQASAQNLAIPKVTLGIDSAKNPQDVAVSVQ